jgi:hypothetical protein
MTKRAKQTSSHWSKVLETLNDRDPKSFWVYDLNKKMFIPRNRKGAEAAIPLERETAAEYREHIILRDELRELIKQAQDSVGRKIKFDTILRYYIQPMIRLQELAGDEDLLRFAIEDTIRNNIAGSPDRSGKSPQLNYSWYRWPAKLISSRIEAHGVRAGAVAQKGTHASEAKARVIMTDEEYIAKKMAEEGVPF